MVKSSRGRNPINIIESVPYSQIILLVASGINYPQKISEHRKIDTSATVKQIEILKERGYFLEPEKEKLLNKTIYTVNWKKINEEFGNYIFKLVLEKRRQLKAYFGDRYEQYIKQQEKNLSKLEHLKEKEQNEERVYNNFQELINSKRLNKNKYLQNFFQILFSDYCKVYIENNIPITIKEIFEEAKQSFGFESFTGYIWTKMLDIIYYQEPFPHKKFRFEKRSEENRERKMKEIEKRYATLRKDKDFEDIFNLEETLRFAFWGFLVPNASHKFAMNMIKEHNLITEKEIEDYKNNVKET